MSAESPSAAVADNEAITTPLSPMDVNDTIPPAAFVTDTRVFAKDEHGALYEAIVRRPNYSNGRWKYLVHYQGWNSRWDRWLEQEELLPDSEQARQQARQEQEAKKEKQRKRKKEEATVKSNKRKSSSASAEQQQENLLQLFQQACELPLTLKTILVEDQERITRRGFDSLYNGFDSDVLTSTTKPWRPARDVHHLPATVTIQMVLNHYCKIHKEPEARRFTTGLATLFDEALPVCLLYPSERAQYNAIAAKSSSTRNNKKVELYGCEFLLRLLVRLPHILAQAPPDNVKGTAKQLEDLIVLLQKNRMACFKPKYREPKPEELVDWECRLRDRTNNVNTSSS